MSKVICDICGTAYQDTAESCPICGYSRNFGAEELKDEQVQDIAEETPVVRSKGGRFAASNVKKKNRAIFDYDAVNDGASVPKEEGDPYDDDEEDYEDEPRSNTFIVVLLVIIIVALLAATGFVFVRYFLPNLLPAEETTAATTESVPIETEPQETTEPTIPCESLSLPTGVPELYMDGMWLLHVTVMPEDTTDVLTYSSANESVAIVSEEGRITATGLGETIIYITCGDQTIECPVVVTVEETEPTVEETVPETTVATEPPLKDVELKLKRTDISLAIGYGVTLELDCDLDPSEVEWSVEHNYIASVDENGFVKALSSGTTAVIVKYGDQEVQCIVRCRK